MDENIKEKIIEKLIENQEALRDVVSDSYTSVRIDNIKQIRELIKNFITIAIGIIGFSIPILGRTDLVKNNIFLVGALAILLIVILYSFYYLKSILENENFQLEEQHKKWNKIIDKLRNNNITFFLSDMTQEDLDKKQKTDQKLLDEISASVSDSDSLTKKEQWYALDIIFYAFLIALILIVLSMIDIL